MKETKENYYKDSNLSLVPAEEKGITRKIKDRVPTVLDNLKHYSKLAGHSALAIAGLFGVVGAPIIAPTAITTTAITALSVGVGAYGLIKGTSEMIYKDEPGLAFVYKKDLKTGEMKLYQDSTQMPSYLNGLTSIQKSTLMSLQSLVGFERYKMNFERTKPLMRDDDGTKVYSQKISTLTHSNNLTMMQVLEDLGYLKICSREPMLYKNQFYETVGPGVQKMVEYAESSLQKRGKSTDILHNGRIGNTISKFYPGEKRTNLIYEKIGFRNFNDLKKMAQESIEARKVAIQTYKKGLHVRYTNGEKFGLHDIIALYNAQKDMAKEESKSFSKPLEKITFRLTDKHFNFEELYDKANGYTELGDMTPKEQKAWRKLRLLFLGEKSKHRGILDLPDTQKIDKLFGEGKKEVKLKKIDIVYDSFNRPILKYGVDKSFGEKREEMHREEERKQRLDEKSDFDKRIAVKTEIKIPVQNTQLESKKIVKESDKELNFDD